MSKVNRAAQFTPFDALKGLQEALRAREEKYSRVEKREISEDRIAEISYALSKIEKGANVKITFFFNGHYVDYNGEISDKNVVLKYLVINETKVFFDDIYELSVVKP